MAAARLEAAVETLIARLEPPARPRPPMAEGSDMVPRAEVAAMAERLDATIARLRRALAEELRPDELRPAITATMIGRRADSRNSAWVRSPSGSMATSHTIGCKDGEEQHVTTWRRRSRRRCG